MNFKLACEEKTKEIEKLLECYLPETNMRQAVIVETMRYNLLAGGKRLRPMMMREIYEMFGGSTREIEPFMVAIEMIHTYSLVHDDLPAMDNDDYRRGRKTTHKVYGEDIAILTGDALLNYAFEVGLQAFEIAPTKHNQVAAAMRILAHKAGIFGMIGGQVIDVSVAGNAITKEELNEIYRLKTGALIESAMMIGAILADVPEETLDVIQKIATNVGRAFQIQDDILDVTSTKEVLGKPIHSDEKNDKPTYVSMIGLAQAKQEVENLSKEALHLLANLNAKSEYVKWLIESLISREK